MENWRKLEILYLSGAVLSTAYLKKGTNVTKSNSTSFAEDKVPQNLSL